MRATVPRLVKDGKSGIWFFRWSLPKPLQQTVNKKSIYVTLQTRDARLAQSLAALMNLRVEAMKKFPNLDESAIRKLLDIDASRGIFKADTEAEQERGLRILESLIRLQGQVIPVQGFTSNVSAGPTPPVPTVALKCPLWRAVADELLREISLTLKKASVDKYRSTYDAFQQQVGHAPLNRLSRHNFKQFKDHLLSSSMVPHTVNGHVGRLYALMEFGLKNGYITGDNPAANLLIPNSKSTIQRRDKFYDDELKAIYNWETYGPMAFTPDYFWGPLVCLFSGMRIEECTSLEVKNIKSDDGVPIMHIKDSKTEAGIRYVPIHSFLIKLGFLDYVAEVKKLGHEGLFWYLSEGALGKLSNHNGTKKNLSRHFSKYLKTVKVKEDDNCFHSLRHTTITRLASRGVNNSTVYVLSGHVTDNSTHYDYLHQLSTKDLGKAIEAVDFHKQLDLTRFDWKPSLQKVLARETKRAKTAESIRLREERIAVAGRSAKQRRSVG